MALIRFITVEGCDGKPACPGCATAEDLLRKVAKLARLRMPPHEEKTGGEYYLSDGRVLEAIHLDCQSAAEKGLKASEAPYLYVDGELVAKGPAANSEGSARQILAALLPHGLADARA